MGLDRIQWWPRALSWLSAANNPKWTRVAAPHVPNQFLVAKKQGIGAIRQRNGRMGQWRLVCGLENNDHDLILINTKVETEYFSPRQFWVSILGDYEPKGVPEGPSYGKLQNTKDRENYANTGKTSVLWLLEWGE